jgi:dolichol-phosphate mannosyltransferase
MPMLSYQTLQTALQMVSTVTSRAVGNQPEGTAASRPSVTVVIPAYRVAPLIADVLLRIPAEVATIIVVDDASPDNLQEVLARVHDPRLVVVRHETNRGVGGAMKTGFKKALELGADVVVKVDGDGQMDPGLIPRFVEPIASGEADFTKGNRFDDLSVIRRMPLVRRIGNLALSFLVKLASGYWHLFDPCNGYLAVRASVLRRVNLARLSDRYFLEISLLCEAYFTRAVLLDVPMQPVYAGETSSLNPVGSALSFAPRLIQRSLYRVFMSYFMRDFTVVSVFLASGVPLMVFGVTWSAVQWIHTYRTNVPATTGTVMVGMLPIVLGFQLLLQALVLDVGNDPKRSR